MIMTRDKALKFVIRQRMARTGEPYSVARRLVTEHDAEPGASAGQGAAGAGQPPAGPGQTSQLPLHALGRLREPEQFGDIVLRAEADGSLLRVRDIGLGRHAASNERENEERKRTNDAFRQRGILSKSIIIHDQRFRPING